AIGFVVKLHGIALMMQGKDALPTLQKAAHLSPHDPEAHCHLGNALQRRGEAIHAAASYRRALEIRPDYAEARFNLGIALHNLRRTEEAVFAYRRVLKLEPQRAEAHNNLGNALRDLGRAPEAVASYRRALEIQPDFAAAHHNLGNALRELGTLGEAIASYRRALEIQPDFAAAHDNLGSALRNVGALGEAIVSHRRALEIEPGSTEAHNNLGNVLLDLLRLDDAAACYRRALAIKPDYAHALTALAMVLRQQGRPAEAEASCRRALEIDPDSATTLAFFAELQADQGRFTEAENLFRRAIAVDPDLPAAWAGLVRCRNMEGGDAAWLAASERLAARALPVRHEINLRYAIGKYYNDVKDYEQAFGHYKRANELTRRYGSRHDRQNLTRRIDRLLTIYGQAWLSRARAEGIPAERPVLIVGMPRSGTTLAEQILASHPGVFGAGELSFWTEAAATCDSCAPEDEAGIGDVAGLARVYLRQLSSLSIDALRVVDKMPTNYMNLGLIHAALPQARIIHMRRSPLDTCLSIYFHNFSIAHPYATDLEDLAHYYSEYVRLMRHWRASLPQEAMLEVPYEQLVEDPEAWSRRMLQFIGLPWDPRCLEFHETERPVITSSRWQVRQKVSRSSVGRWRNYERFIAPLRDLLQLE
ncbi:MAG: tetratricopeptide repeat protein, partial [Steroidobacteraceae bacterium]